MRRLVATISVPVLAACALGLLYLSHGTRGASPVAAEFPPVAPLPLAAPAVPPTEAFPLDQSRPVDLGAERTLLAELTPQERRDQYLDWLLFTALTGFVPSTEEFNRATFDLPAIRHGYMRPLANFEYGDTRSRFIGNGTVLALIPANAQGNVRKDHLAHIADEHRKNLGGQFERLLVIEYGLDVDKQSATLSRRADVKADALFSAEYGYVERLVASADDFATFMKQADDLTAATKTSSGPLLLGGRKILGRSYRPITIEMVATVWQAERKIQAALLAFEQYANRLENEFIGRWSRRTYSTGAERAQLERERDADAAQVREKILAERRRLKLVQGAGFSLDPSYRHKELAKDFLQAGAFLGLDAKDVQEVVAALEDEQKGDRRIAPFFKVASQLKEKSDAGDGLIGLRTNLLELLLDKNSFQAARYDGELQGTEVGMVLFYTDLLAKLWVIDFRSSSPSKAIPGFLDGPSVPSALIYQAENQELNSGRLWFGKSDLGFQLAPTRDSIFLARNATRVYSAGSNPLNPGVEQESSVSLGTPIIWWNDHYEEIARHEQEYERLNQIMKWSIVIGWLNDSYSGDKLNYLAAVNVNRAKHFPTWVKSKSGLRFKEWDHIGFFPAGYQGLTTEAMPLLQGREYTQNDAVRQFSGGVSLAPKSTFSNRVAIDSGLVRTALRSNINYGAENAGQNLLKTFENTTYRFATGESNVVTLVVKARPEAKMRATTAELVNAEVERVIVRSGDVVRMETRAATVPLGEMEIARASNGFRVGWQSRELDVAHSAARRMSVEANPAHVLARDPNVTAVIRLPGESDFLAQMRGSERWLHFAKEPRPSRDLPAGWHMRASDYKDVQRNVYVAALDRPRVHDVIGNRHLVIDGLAEDGKVILRVADRATPAGTRLIDVEAGGVRVKVWVEPETGSVHLASGTRELPNDLAAFTRRFGRADLDAIRAAAARADTAPVRLSGESVAQARLAAATESRNVRDLALSLAAESAAARAALERHLTRELAANARIVAEQGPQAAIRHVDGLLQLYGPIPELTLRRGLLHIDANRLPDAVAALAPARRPMRGPEKFFEEINFRLADQRRPADARRNVLRYAEHAEFRDVLARRRNSGDAVQPIHVDGRFDFNLRLAKMPETRAVTAEEAAKLRRGEAVIYRQNTSGLNNLDWNVSIERSLQQMTEGRLGTVVRLPRGDIAHFRPSTIYVADGNRAFNKIELNLQVRPELVNSYSACNESTGSCSEQSSNDKQSPEIYLIVGS